MEERVGVWKRGLLLPFRSWILMFSAALGQLSGLELSTDVGKIIRLLACGNHSIAGPVCPNFTHVGFATCCVFPKLHMLFMLPVYQYFVQMRVHNQKGSCSIIVQARIFCGVVVGGTATCMCTWLTYTLP